MKPAPETRRDPDALTRLFLTRNPDKVIGQGIAEARVVRLGQGDDGEPLLTVGWSVPGLRKTPNVLAVMSLAAAWGLFTDLAAQLAATAPLPGPENEDGHTAHVATFRGENVEREGGVRTIQVTPGRNDEVTAVTVSLHAEGDFEVMFHACPAVALDLADRLRRAAAALMTREEP